MRYWSFVALCILSSNWSAAAALPNGVFCQREKYRLNVLAAQVLQNGDVKFGLSKWEGSQNFRLFGIAKRVGSDWGYTERGSEWIYNEERQDWDFAEDSRTKQLTCKVSISWSKDGSISLAVDKLANCPGHAGYGFVEKSSGFTAQDYLRKVTFELNDSDTFLSARTADGC